MGGARGFEARVVSLLLAGVLVLGVGIGLLVTPGAGGARAVSSSASATVRPLTHSAVVSYSAHPGVVDATGPTTDPSSAPAPAVAASLAVSPPATTGAVAVPTTEAQVAQDLIVAIDRQSKGSEAITTTPGNVALLVSWMDNEGGLWANNPLNTSLDAGRYPHEITTSGQDTGIPIFPSIDVGIEATATTLLSNRVYAPILDVLGEGTGSCAAFARAVIDSPWAASHYGGDPSRFCGAGGSGSVAVTTACLRVPGRGAHRAARMPGVCGRRSTAVRRHVARVRSAGARADGARAARARAVGDHGARATVRRWAQRRSSSGTGSSPRRLR